VKSVALDVFTSASGAKLADPGDSRAPPPETINWVLSELNFGAATPLPARLRSLGFGVILYGIAWEGDDD
jgi:hypothetical protein